MPKYRYLSLEELQELEKEFVEYLVLNGITADDWEKLKAEDPEKADKVIELFSDVVFESILRKVEYLEYRTPHEVRTFQCLPDRLVVVGMKAENDPEIDFTDSGFIQSAMENPPSSLRVYTTEKHYEKPRELALFEMTEAGCIISDGRLFKTLCLSL
jgi:hypothetical protein